MPGLTRGMDGPHLAKGLVSAFLEQDLPARLNSYRNIWNLDDYALPTPQKYLDYEPEAIDAWPTIITVAINAPAMIRDDYEDYLDPVYRVQYSMRTYIWVKTELPGPVTLMRDRLTTVVRSALLDHPALGNSLYDVPCELRVDETTMREEYSEVTPVKGDRYMAGAYISYTINLNEVVMRATIGTLTDVDVDAELLPEAPT